MKEKLEQIKAEALKQIQNSDALDKLNDIRVNYLGKKGELTAVLKSMKDVAADRTDGKRDKAGNRDRFRAGKDENGEGCSGSQNEKRNH